MPVKLTNKLLENLKPPPRGRIEKTDSVARGLAFRLTAKGSATWSLVVRVDGRQRRFSIGDYPDVTLAKARVIAGKLRAEVLGGRDPVAERRATRATVQSDQETAVRDVLARYSAMHLMQLRDGRRREAQLRTALSPYMDKNVTDLGQRDLQAAVDAKAGIAPVAANRLRAALSHFAGWCRRRGYLPNEALREIEKPTREAVRERLLSLDEIGRIWQASLAETVVFGSFVRLLILTAQRRGDLAGMTWAELKGDRWEIPGSRTKNGRPHIVHLTPPAWAEINKISSSRSTRA